LWFKNALELLKLSHSNVVEENKRLSQPGCYSLVIKLNRTNALRVGKLGATKFSRGTYIYTGSAMKGLAARLRRHCQRHKKIHWHIDYLLDLPEARIKQIAVYPPAPGQECRQNRRIAALPGATIPLKGFGATDCRSGCASHLTYFPLEAKLKLASGVSIDPRSLFTARGDECFERGQTCALSEQ
jgi:Uri superfamily endonuclease